MGQIKNIKLHIVTDIKQRYSMATRQVAARAVNWAALAARVPKDGKAAAGFEELRIKFETSKGTLNMMPEKPTPINWDHYSSVVKNKELFEKFQSAYAELEVPYPEDDFSAEIEAKRAEAEAQDAHTRAELADGVAQAEASIAAITGIKAYEAMTMDEYCELNPKFAHMVEQQRIAVADRLDPRLEKAIDDAPNLRSFLWLKYGGMLDFSSVFQRRWKSCWDHIVIPGFEYLNEEDNRNMESFKATLTEAELAQFEFNYLYEEADKLGKEKILLNWLKTKVEEGKLTEDELANADELGQQKLMLKIGLEEGAIDEYTMKALE